MLTASYEEDNKPVRFIPNLKVKTSFIKLKVFGFYNKIFKINRFNFSGGKIRNFKKFYKAFFLLYQTILRMF